MAKQIGLWNPATITYDPVDYDYDLPNDWAMERPDLTYLSADVTVEGQRYRVRCGLIFCETCEGCMACADSHCLAGEQHEWPEGWEELVEALD